MRGNEGREIRSSGGRKNSGNGGRKVEESREEKVREMVGNCGRGSMRSEGKSCEGIYGK